ncbi:UreE urease accessory domain-containing protein [Pseudodesulfovibrio mercurii]|uniref:Urease accessory protein UreE n=1 Tax=Pseudodesulfovibrio mercurii TaxID=641491 RepID=F0JE34_9BACT|nr:urease accessory protein UreE [Pseudodesulfovibrio mercurii]EGB14643.1 UreE urease accessory domain-containing protein [Pseudodesulfovibrio mercurii]
MLRIREILAAPDGRTDDALTLPHHLRARSRQRVRLDSGREAGLLLPRGTVLRDGDVLLAEDGCRVLVRADIEPLSEACFADGQAMAMACFHLGNRHVPLEIGLGRIRYIHDPVVDDMLRTMGFAVTALMGPFHPEAGAYHMPHIRLNCEPVYVGSRP